MTIGHEPDPIEPPRPVAGMAPQEQDPNQISDKEMVFGLRRRLGDKETEIVVLQLSVDRLLGEISDLKAVIAASQQD